MAAFFAPENAANAPMARNRKVIASADLLQSLVNPSKCSVNSVVAETPSSSAPDGQPVPGLGELPQVGGLVDVEVVPDEHDRAAELLMGGDQQVPVVAPGEALASVPSALVPAWPVNQWERWPGL